MKRLVTVLLTVTFSIISSGNFAFAEKNTANATAIFKGEVAVNGASINNNAAAGSAATANATPAGKGKDANTSDKRIPEPDTVIGKLENIEYKSKGDFEIITISANNYTEYSCMELKNPLRIVVDIKNLIIPEGYAVINTNGKMIERVRYSQYTRTDGRFVLDVRKGYDYTVENTKTGLTIHVSEKSAQKNPDKAKALMFTETLGVQYVPGDINEAVSLLLINHKGFKVSRLTEPEKLIITIPDAGLISTSKSVSINGTQIKSISYEKYKNTGAIITLTTNGQYQYSFAEDSGKLMMSLSRPAYKNIIYHNNGDRVFFELKNSKLTKGDRTLKPLYQESYDKTGRIYTVTFPTGQADLAEGRLDINDAYIQSFEVKRDKIKDTTSLIFRALEKISYLVYTRESGTTAITAIKPASGGDKIVAIDPGHGGTATGTTYGSTKEKDLNLDISIRLNSLLQDRGIMTYLVRNDDSNVDNYERAYIANKLNASLYLSVHINAIGSRSYKGTMTLYYPTLSDGFVGKDFASILQKSIVKNLKTVNIGLRSRPDLIVLRETNMPAAIAEIAFLTNSTDRSNLRKEPFRQKAAEALCDAVIQALKHR